MKWVLPFTLCALLCMNNAWATNKTLQSEFWRIVTSYNEEHGENAWLLDMSYDKNFKDDMKIICKKIENFIATNNLSISVSRENSELIAGDKNYNCAHVCDEPVLFSELMMLNLACIELLPDGHVDNGVSLASNNVPDYMFNHLVSMISTSMVDFSVLLQRQGYQVAGNGGENCGVQDDGTVRCTVNRVATNKKNNSKLVLSNCCVYKVYNDDSVETVRCSNPNTYACTPQKTNNPFGGECDNSFPNYDAKCQVK